MRLTGTISSVCILVSIAATACSSDPADPESQIRELLVSAEAAAEAREQGFFRDFIAEDYSDDMGRDRAEMLALARVYFLRNQSIHILSRIESIEFLIPELAKVTLSAGMAGRDGQVDGQWTLRADVYRFELELRRAGGEDWELIRAQWERGAATSR